MKLAIIGDGKMGRALRELAPAHGFDVAAFLGSEAVRPRGLTAELLGGADVAVEFTEAGAAAANIRGCLAAGVPVISGTTGWEDERARLEAEVRARGSGGLLWAPNFSIGVHIFLRLVAEAARQVTAAGGFDAHLVETHHAAKKDAPSGTARRIQEIAGAHLPLGVTSVRVGHVPGMHALTFDAPYEQIALVHEARDRRVFADGALLAAKWMIGRSGVFTLNDILP